MEGVPGLVQQRHHVVHQADGVHENEWPTPEMERFAVPARRLALSAVEIEQALVDHGLELRAEHRVDLVEDPTGSAHKFLYGLERAERSGPVRIDGQVPRAQRV